MIIGVPKERKIGERRVAIVPDCVAHLTSKGHTVLIEEDAGKLSGIDNLLFSEAGAKIVSTLEEVWSADLVIKVKEPAPGELKLFRDGQTVFCFLHLAVLPEVAKALLKNKIIGLDYDLLMLDNGRLPILEPMSIIAGKLSIQCGAYALQANCGGSGILLSGTPGVAPAKVLVLGAGAAGSNAAKVALGMGAAVTIVDINPEKLAYFADGPYRARTLYSSPPTLAREVLDSDLIVGAVLKPGAIAPKLLTRQMIASMKPASVLVDICIDQGGCAETSRPTTIAEPTYVESGVIHYCVTNMPALVPQTSTKALASETSRWLELMADLGVEKALETVPPITRSLASKDGRITNRVIAEGLGFDTI